MSSAHGAGFLSPEVNNLRYRQLRILYLNIDNTGLPNLKIVPESNFAVLCPFVRECKTPVRIADVRKGIHVSTIIEVMLAIFAATAGSAPHEPVIIILD
jgi:hypothetical protein